MPNWTIVLDLGAYTTKIGWGGENEPRYTFYTVTGVPKYSSIGLDKEKQIFVGNEIIDAMGLYKITYPIENGDIVDWKMFEAIIEYIFYLLRSDPSTVNVLFTIDPFISKESKRRLFELFLEKYQTMGYYPIRGALLTMYSGGFDTGLVVDMGASNIRITPIYQNFIIEHAIQSVEIGGNVLDIFMKQKMIELGFSAESSVQKELVRVLKEKACFTSLNFAQDLKNQEKFIQQYSLPDGSTIKIGKERFLIPELLFKPELNHLETSPLHKAILDCIEFCDVDIRSDLLQNVFLTGGSSMFPLLETRLKQELQLELSRRKKNMEIHIIAPKERVFSNWVGGSIISMIPEFQSNWITRKRYFEEGIPPNFL